MALHFFAILALLSTCTLGQNCHVDRSFTYDPNKPLIEQNGKTKSSSHGLQWLSKYMLPVPKSAYKADRVSYHTDLQNNLTYFQWDVEWWKWYLECVDDHQIYTQPDFGYCNTTYYSNNNTCQGNQWVGLPLWIESDLNDWGAFSFDTGNESFWNWGTWFMEQANSSNPRSVQHQLDKQIHNVSEQTITAYYQIIGDYLGVGFSVSCRDHIVNTLNGADAFDQAGWQAATTLMALIPVLLTFGNLFVARSSEAFGTSFLVGIMSAVFSLGLPVKSISGIREKQQVTVSRFEFYARQTIAIFGKPLKRSHITGGHRSAAYPTTLADLQKWSADPPKNTANIVLSKQQESTDCSFGDIRRRALKWQRRAHMWHISALLVAIAQGILFLFAIGPLFVGYGTPLLLFDCNNFWTSLWLIVSAGISALFRLAMWEVGAHERVKIYALSSRSKSSLRRFIHDSQAYTLGEEDRYLLNTTETQLPPLHPALITSVSHSLYRIWIRTLGCCLRCVRLPRRVKARVGSGHRTESVDSDYEGVAQMSTDLYDKPEVNSSRIRIRLEMRLLRTQIWTALTSPLQFMQGGYSTQSMNTSAMRYRPMMVLMHLSTEGRNPLMTLFTGAVEGIILIVLTVFFGAAWGGNLLVLCYVMAVLLVTITAGRALGLWYVVRSARLFGLHVIETQSPRQIIGCLRILCSMKEVLVFVNSAWFFEGHRLDEREGWAVWKLAYERGDYDEDIVLPSESAPPLPASNISNHAPKVSIGSQHNDGSTSVVSPMGSIRLPRRSTERAPEHDEEIGMASPSIAMTEHNLVTPQRSASQTSQSSSRRPPFQYQHTASSSIPLVQQHSSTPERRNDGE